MTNMQRTLSNISERDFFAKLLNIFKPIVRLSTIEWAKKYRIITSIESSVGIGNFDPDITPYMEYVYDCLDNPFIPTIVAKKSARIGWTEVINNFRGKTIHLNPKNMLLAFPTQAAARTFASGKWKEFISNVLILREIINLGIAKNRESMFQYLFPNGSLRLVTLGSISNQKSDNIPYIEIEEPDDAKDDVNGQGDSFLNLKERQKTVPLVIRKFIFGGTPTNKDFSRVEKAIKASNWMVFKAKCHECDELVAMDYTAFECLHYDDYKDKYIDEIYGKSNPDSAYFLCPFCQTDWSFEQKSLNIIAGKKFGFTDHTGNFSKGWHPKNPAITDTFGFDFSEIMSPFKDGSNFTEIAKARILAEIELAKGNEAPMKSFYNNKKGEPYASGFSALEPEEMKLLRSNYTEGVVPYEGLILTMGIDVQHNRFAYVIIAWGRNGCCWLVEWKEIFGNVFNWEDPVWAKLTSIIVSGVPHVTGKTLPIDVTSIDSGDGHTAELVYRWVRRMNFDYNEMVLATKGVRELRYSTDDIYQEPRDIEVLNTKQDRRSMAESLGVRVYMLGAHRCHDEILRRIVLNQNKDIVNDVFYFNEQSYGNFEEQMTSCRKLIDLTSNSAKEVYHLIAGKRKEAMDSCKNAFHAAYHRRIREFTDTHWRQLEEWIYNDNNLDKTI